KRYKIRFASPVCADQHIQAAQLQAVRVPIAQAANGFKSGQSNSAESDHAPGLWCGFFPHLTAIRRRCQRELLWASRQPSATLKASRLEPPHAPPVRARR